MFDIQNDLPLTSYGFLGLLFVGYELGGLRAALLMAAALAIVVILLSLLGALVTHIRGETASPPHTGGNSSSRIR